ncbi:hypothetical protein HN587_07585 [Candidatus Woesearchaeota archaeon]|jgi:hypothetical protein|nr:hypothetical protein [Candidatus Woesearchaeota archaeon]
MRSYGTNQMPAVQPAGSKNYATPSGLFPAWGYDKKSEKKSKEKRKKSKSKTDPEDELNEVLEALGLGGFNSQYGNQQIANGAGMNPANPTQQKSAQDMYRHFFEPGFGLVPRGNSYGMPQRMQGGNYGPLNSGQPAGQYLGAQQGNPFMGQSMQSQYPGMPAFDVEKTKKGGYKLTPKTPVAINLTYQAADGSTYTMSGSSPTGDHEAVARNIVTGLYGLMTDFKGYSPSAGKAEKQYGGGMKGIFGKYGGGSKSTPYKGGSGGYKGASKN